MTTVDGGCFALVVDIMRVISPGCFVSCCFAARAVRCSVSMAIIGLALVLSVSSEVVSVSEGFSSERLPVERLERRS